jgi:pseudomonalisin
VSQFVAAYAPTSSQVQSVVNYIAAQGLSNIQVAPNNLFVTADGTVAEIGAAFFTLGTPDVARLNAAVK